MKVGGHLVSFHLTVKNGTYLATIHTHTSYIPTYNVWRRVSRSNWTSPSDECTEKIVITVHFVLGDTRPSVFLGEVVFSGGVRSRSTTVFYSASGLLEEITVP